MRGLRISGVAVLMAVSLVACGGDDDDESAGTGTTASDSPTTASGDGEPTATTDERGTSTTNTSTEPCGETGDWTTAPEQVLAGSADPTYLLDAGRHDALSATTSCPSGSTEPERWGIPSATPTAATCGLKATKWSRVSVMPLC